MTPELQAKLLIRQWCFDRAVSLRKELDLCVDIIYIATEIEAYLTEGKNARNEFMCCVDTAIMEVEHAAIAGVSESSKGKVLEKVKIWLKEYKAL